MSTVTLAISCLTTSSLPWFMDLTFQVPVQSCSLQHWTLPLSPVTCTTGYSFALAPSLNSFWSYFSTDLLQHTGHLLTQGVPVSVSYHFAFSYCSWGFQGKNTEVVCHSLLQGVFPTLGSNPGLPHCMEILYLLSHQRSPRILQWVAYPFFSGSSWPRKQTRVPCITGRFFTSWATRYLAKYH